MTEIQALNEISSPLVNSGGAIAAIGVFTWFMKASVIPHLEKKDQYIRGIVQEFNMTIQQYVQKSILSEEKTRESIRHFEEKMVQAEKSNLELARSNDELRKVVEERTAVARAMYNYNIEKLRLGKGHKKTGNEK